MYKNVLYTPVNGTVTHLKLQKSQKVEYWAVLQINISFTFEVTSAGREAIRPLSAGFGHVTQATPTLGWFYDLDAVGIRRLCLCQF